MTTTRKRKAPPPADGFHLVELSASFERRGFTYRPGVRLRVNAALLQEMQGAGVVANVSSL